MVNVNIKTPEDRNEEKRIKRQSPIKLRENPFAKSNKKWYEFWKQEPEYGRRIELNDRQIQEAVELQKLGERVILSIKDENYKTIPEPETIEPILLLMKENGYTDVLENVKTGEFIIATPNGEKSIWLTPDKLQSIKVQDRYYKGWIAYENCMTPYPEDPIYSAELQRKIIQKVAMNYQNLNEAAIITAKTKMWLYIIGAVVIGLVLLLSTEFGQNLISNIGNSSGGEAVKEVAKKVVENVTTSKTGVNTGVIVS